MVTSPARRPLVTVLIVPLVLAAAAAPVAAQTPSTGAIAGRALCQMG